MKIKKDFQKYKIKKRMNGDLRKHINRYDNNNNNNIYSNKKKKIENYSNFKEKRKYNNYTFLIPKKIMKTLLSSMNKNTHLSLNNLNTINFIFQTYEKGMDILQHKPKYRNKSSYIKNCMNQKKFFTNYNPNFSICCSISGNTGRANEISENYKSSNNEELLNFNESFYKKENNSNLIISHNNFFKNNVSMKNIDSNYTRLINKKKNNNKSTSNNNNNIRYIIKRSFSCKMPKDKNLNKSKKTNDKLSNNNEYDNSNTLLSIKRDKKKYFSYINNKKIKSSMYGKIKINNVKENALTLKIFTEKYEKEKENFNNILFDEGIEHRKKKFKLEGFIKRFANQHFVEKLYKAKEYSVKKNIIK